MIVPQAIFTSAETGRMKGYQLVSRSAEIDSELAQELCRWSPTHAALAAEAPDSWSFQAFPVGGEWTVVARTFYGGPEYSSRGGLQVVTRILVLTREQMRGYRDDALAVARTALALGRLSLPPEFPEHLPPAELPECPIIPSEAELGEDGEQQAAGDAEAGESSGALDQARRGLLGGRRVAVVGSKDPLGDLQRLMASTPEPPRRQLSFATGLKPSAARPFRLHFLPDASLQRSMSSQGIQCVGATHGAAATAPR